jgi:hypothetical protein
MMFPAIEKKGVASPFFSIDESKKKRVIIKLFHFLKNSAQGVEFFYCMLFDRRYIETAPQNNAYSTNVF